MKSIFGLIGIVVLLLGATGWCVNIIELTKCDFASPYKAEVIRGVGIVVPPVGAIVGWMNIGK